MKQNKYIKLSALLMLIASPVLLTSCGDKKTDSDQGATTETTKATPYPLEVCLVSGEELGSMGEPHVFVHNGQEIKMCCDKCVPKFNKDPEKYLAKLKKGQTESKETDHSGHNH